MINSSCCTIKQAIMHRFTRPLQRTAESVGIGRAVAFDDDAPKAEQSRAIVSTIFDTVAQTVKHRLGQRACGHGQSIAVEFGAHHGGDHFCHAFYGLQDNITDKTVADYDIDRAFADIVALDVTVEIQAAAAQKLSRLFDDFVALDDFFADIEQADRSEEHTSELQSLMRISYAVFCLKKKKPKIKNRHNTNISKTTNNKRPQQSNYINKDIMQGI